MMIIDVTFYDPQTGEIHSLFTGSGDTLVLQSAYQFCDYLSGAYSSTQFYIDVATSQPVAIDPAPAAGYYFDIISKQWALPEEDLWAQIKHWRDTHELSPVTTTVGTFHADNLSVEQRMKGAIEQFDDLPTLNADGTLTWKCPGPVYHNFTQAQLQTGYTELKHLAALRSAVLHVKASMFQQMATPPTPAQLSNINFWIEG